MGLKKVPNWEKVKSDVSDRIDALRAAWEGLPPGLDNDKI